VLHYGLGYDRHVKGKRGESTMAVARVSEIVASSADSIEGAIQEGLKRATKTIRGITGFEVMRVQGKVDKGKLKEYRVHMNVTFVLDE
jgi:flavin-binding protein dodecin